MMSALATNTPISTKVMPAGHSRHSTGGAHLAHSCPGLAAFPAASLQAYAVHSEA
jgi:hypothetical protein